MPERRSPYSQDLRWRIVWQRVGLNMKVEAIANNLGVDASTVSRIVQLFSATGDVKKRVYPKNSRPTMKLTDPVKLHILHIVLQQPEIYLKELQLELCVITGVHVCESSMCTFLKESNFTRHRLLNREIMN